MDTTIYRSFLNYHLLFCATDVPKALLREIAPIYTGMVAGDRAYSPKEIEEAIKNTEESIRQMDPTSKGIYKPWIALQIKKYRLTLGSDEDRHIFDYLKYFDLLKTKKRLTGAEANIQIYDLESLKKKLSEFPLYEGFTYREGLDLQSLLNLPGVSIEAQNSEWVIVKVTSGESSMRLGDSTKWCTRHSQGYVPNFVVFKRGSSGLTKTYQYQPNLSQFKNIENEEVIPPHSLLVIMKEVPLEKKIGWATKSGDRLSPEDEKSVANNHIYAYFYARDVIKGRWPEGEAMIAEIPQYALDYARDIIKGRFPIGERVIAQFPNSSFEYARDVIKGRWPEGEVAIAADAKWSFKYAEEVIKDRFELGEYAISKNSRYSYLYAYLVINGRFELGEPEIAKDATRSLDYAVNVIGGRFELGEEAIIHSAHYGDYSSFLKKKGITI